MTDHEPVPAPWPGAEPAPFEFPYAEAAAARTALEELHAELTDTDSIHSAALAELGIRNQGETIGAFRRGYYDQLHDSATAWLGVIGAIGDLDDLVACARLAEQARADAHAAWMARDGAY